MVRSPLHVLAARPGDGAPATRPTTAAADRVLAKSFTIPRISASPSGSESQPAAGTSGRVYLPPLGRVKHFLTISGYFPRNQSIHPRIAPRGSLSRTPLRTFRARSAYAIDSAWSRWTSTFSGRTPQPPAV